jgi:hypothetical protein
MKHRAGAALLGLIFALAGCGRASTPMPAPARPAPASATALATAPAPQATAPEACPDTDFDAFLKRFETSADAQRAASADPLTMTRIDPDAQPEPAAVTRHVPRAQVRFPVLPDAATRRAQGLELRVSPGGGNARDVVVGLPDSGAQVRLAFELRDCWTLVRVDDESI